MDNPNEDKRGSIANALECLREKFGWTAAMVRFAEAWDDRNAARKEYLMQNKPGMRSPPTRRHKQAQLFRRPRQPLNYPIHINNLSHMTAFIKLLRPISLNVYASLQPMPGVVSTPFRAILFTGYELPTHPAFVSACLAAVPPQTKKWLPRTTRNRASMEIASEPQRAAATMQCSQAQPRTTVPRTCLVIPTASNHDR